MTNEEIVVAIQSGTGNRQELLEQLYCQNYGMIETIVKKYSGIEDPEDLRQESFFGVVRAAEMWDPKREANYCTYMLYWVRSAINRYVEECGGVIRIPAHRRALMRKYRSEWGHFINCFGRKPSDRELCGLLGLTREQLDDLKRDIRASRIRSTSEVIGGENDVIVLEDVLPAEGDPIEDLVEKIQHEEMSAEVWSCVDSLQPQQTEVIRSRYKDQKTLKECGEALGVSAEYVRSIESKALRELRKPKFTKRLSPYLTEGYIHEVGYRGSIGLFKRHGSIEERIVMTLENISGPIWKNKLDDIEKMRKEIRASSHEITQEG